MGCITVIEISDGSVLDWASIPIQEEETYFTEINWDALWFDECPICAWGEMEQDDCEDVHCPCCGVRLSLSSSQEIAEWRYNRLIEKGHIKLGKYKEI